MVAERYRSVLACDPSQMVMCGALPRTLHRQTNAGSTLLQREKKTLA